MADTKVEKILDALITYAAKVIDADCLYAALYNKITAQLEFPLVLKREGERLKRQEARKGRWASRPYRPSEILPDLIFVNGQAALNIVEDFAGWLKKHKVMYEADERPLSWLGVPLIARGRVTGVVVAENYTRAGVYDDRTSDLLSALAQRAAGALANARLVESLRAVNEVGQRLTSGIRLTQNEILDLIYEQAGRLMDTRNMYVALYDEDKQELSFPLAIYKGERQLSWPFREVDIADETKGGLTEVVIRTKSPLCPMDVEAEYRNRNLNPPIPPIPKSWLGVPMIGENWVIGVIALQNDDVANLYGPDDLEVLQTMATQAAAAIDNVRLYTQLEVERSELRSRLINAERLLVASKFAASYIHRVNNLVGTIPIRVGQIEEQLADAPAIFRKLEPYLNGIVADASRVSPITKELAELTQQEPKKEIVDVVDVLARVARRVRIETPAEIQLEEDYPEEPVWIWAVAWELSDAFWNVAKNGAEAMLPDGGLLSLIVTKVVDELGHMWVEIRIHDAGPKIPEQILSQIFEPFHSTKGGVGYGLWRTQHVVRDLGGSINISNDDNELPNGKTAMFRLPITIKNKGGNA